MENMKPYFMSGPLVLQSETIEARDAPAQNGGHAIFLGRVRADKNVGKQVIGIEYSNYTEMAAKSLAAIEKRMLEKYPRVSEIVIQHSTGLVKTGQISMIVEVCSPHRNHMFQCLEETVKTIKKEVPIWKKEIFDDNSHVWKEN